MRHVTVAIIAIMLAGSPVMLSSKSPAPSPQEEIEASMEKLNNDLKAIDLKINRLTWEKYLDDAERNNRIISIFALKAFDLSALSDTLPHLREANRLFKEANEELLEVLKTDSLYDRIRREYAIANRAKDKEGLAQNKQEYQEMYQRLRKNNPDYPPAREKRDRALVHQNVLIGRYLLEHFQNRNEVMPIDDVIPKSDQRNIRLTNELQVLMTEQMSLLMLRHRLQNKLLELKYGVPDTEKTSEKRAKRSKER